MEGVIKYGNMQLYLMEFCKIYECILRTSENCLTEIFKLDVYNVFIVKHPTKQEAMQMLKIVSISGTPYCLVFLRYH